MGSARRQWTSLDYPGNSYTPSFVKAREPGMSWAAIQGRREMKPETEEHCIRYPEAARKRQKNLKEPYYRA